NMVEVKKEMEAKGFVKPMVASLAGDVEVEEEADARRPHRRRKGIPHPWRAVGEKELESQFDTANGGLRPAGFLLRVPSPRNAPGASGVGPRSGSRT
ncbi:MAG: hypothetical protein J0H53_05630, partial [Rhizobiales bacterium]|nr:hypothetical protein [Hyphomicrobiales bacterium]